MNALTPRATDAQLDSIIKLAILAVGGQGGGVLTGWIETLARSQDWACQATSVAGVAQRTGATIYYIEMAPMTGGAAPVFSLAPAPGDIDIMIAAEMMEAGRAVMRGFVTPDRTTLIASTHRALAVSEKTVPGDGIASSDEVRAAAEIAADRLIMFDMDRLAADNGSVISSALFGALAGSGTLPFDRAAFEEAIRASGKGVKASLRAFDAAFTRAQSDEDEATPPEAATAAIAPTPVGPNKLRQRWDELAARLQALPAPARSMAGHGLRKTVGFQDIAYGREYLNRLDRIVALDSDAQGYALTMEAAKYIANAMAYDDVIRVADLKTRASRFDRITAEMGASDKLMHVTDFMHPRAEEIAGLLPARLGARIEASPRAMGLLSRLFKRGKRLRSDAAGPFLMLWVLGGLRGWRRASLRHRQEQGHLDRWLSRIEATAPRDYALAVELTRCRRLIKGYSDTHTRGLSKFDRVLAGADLLDGRADAAEWVARLREAALQDEQGKALDGAIETVRSFA